jgi:CRISPR/Cas system CSM-associated protein Csm3 (group 7 of RAMP superfamily)
MTVLSFTVTFYGPFRVGAPYARDGIHATVDPDDALPADHLKGVMRAAAAQLLGGAGHPAISAVFGSPRTPSPWAWSHATPLGQADWTITQRHRVTIDEHSHSASKDHLVLGEQAWAPQASFAVTRVGMIPGDDGLPEPAHTTLLRCAAAGVHGLGGWRRRGLGWVGIAADAAPVTAEDITLIRELAAQRHPAAAEAQEARR